MQNQTTTDFTDSQESASPDLVVYLHPDAVTEPNAARRISKVMAKKERHWSDLSPEVVRQRIARLPSVDEVTLEVERSQTDEHLEYCLHPYRKELLIVLCYDEDEPEPSEVDVVRFSGGGASVAICEEISRLRFAQDPTWMIYKREPVVPRVSTELPISVTVDLPTDFTNETATELFKSKLRDAKLRQRILAGKEFHNLRIGGIFKSAETMRRLSDWCVRVHHIGPGSYEIMSSDDVAEVYPVNNEAVVLWTKRQGPGLCDFQSTRLASEADIERDLRLHRYSFILRTLIDGADDYSPADRIDGSSRDPSGHAPLYKDLIGDLAGGVRNTEITSVRPDKNTQMIRPEADHVDVAARNFVRRERRPELIRSTAKPEIGQGQINTEFLNDRPFGEDPFSTLASVLTQMSAEDMDTLSGELKITDIEVNDLSVKRQLATGEVTAHFNDSEVEADVRMVEELGPNNARLLRRILHDVRQKTLGYESDNRLLIDTLMSNQVDRLEETRIYPTDHPDLVVVAWPRIVGERVLVYEPGLRDRLVKELTSNEYNGVSHEVTEGYATPDELSYERRPPITPGLRVVRVVRRSEGRSPVLVRVERRSTIQAYESVIGLTGSMGNPEIRQARVQRKFSVSKAVRDVLDGVKS